MVMLQLVERGCFTCNTMSQYNTGGQFRV